MALRIDIVTLFPEMFEGFCAAGIVGRAIRGGLVEIHRTNIRQFATDSYGTVDDAPFGGGPGMVLTCPPVFAAVEFVQKQTEAPGKVILLTPQGKPMNQDMAGRLADQERLILLAGHYEGFDERIRVHLAEMEISLGDFVLSGGEVAAMAVCDAVIRLLPGALGKDESVVEESFSMGLLEYPQYTRPREFRGMGVPEVLLSGDHERIARWRRQQAESRTRKRRPGLWEAYRRNRKNSGQE
ncbi:MAG: tRNA (guanosine(37)-N1)-methyltransferase TrmD [Phycisphaerae bacterium]|jgi:tRNA (guanine37-N1)-methyltransferase|nr:tRNA (guanosine(37)-N1)-methyltransferase TrmD [Phycisphaerae bacterium]